MKVINLLAGPGSGKSTTAAGLFYLMKTQGYKVELVTEYIKYMAYEKRHSVFEDQLYVFAKQHRRMWIMKGQVDWIITDSPLLLSALYSPRNYFKAFIPLVMEAHENYINYNFFITRVKKYAPYGRGQTETEAKALDNRLEFFLNNELIPFKYVDGDKDAPRNILAMIDKGFINGNK